MILYSHFLNQISFEGCLSHASNTYSLHQDKLCAANKCSVDPRSFLSEYADTLLQPLLLHLCWHVIL